MQLNIFGHQGALIPACLHHSEKLRPLLSIQLIISLGKKATGPSLSSLPCARKVLVPTQHVIHSDFDFLFFLSYFIMFVLFLLCCFLCLYVLCLISYSRAYPPPSIVVSPDRNVGKYHPSDLTPFCMHQYTSASDCLIIALMLMYSTDKSVVSQCLPSEIQPILM